MANLLSTNVSGRLYVSGYSDVNPTNGAFRFYDGSTFRGGLGLNSWAFGGGSANDLNLYVANDSTLYISTNGINRHYFNSGEAAFKTYAPDLNYKISVVGGDQFNAYYGSGAATLYLQYHGNAGGDVRIAGNKFRFDNGGHRLIIAKSSGTMISNDSMDDAIGWNGSYGTYIGSTVGGTSYLYANGTFYTGGVFRTLIHSGNIGSQSVNYASSAGNADTVGGRSVGNGKGNVGYFDSNGNLYINNPESYSGEVRLGAAWGYGGVYASGVLSLSTSSSNIYFVFNNSIPISMGNDASIALSGSTNTPVNITGSAHKYLTINPGNGYEAMVRYIGGSGSSWYVGKRTSSQLIGTESFHFYSEAAGATVGGINPSGDMIVTGSMRAPIFYDSNNTSYYLDPNSSTSGYFAGTLRQNDGKYVRDSNYRTISGYSDYYSGGGAGWYRVAEITLTGNCSGAVLYGTLYDHRYDGADAYQISIVARAECDFTSNNESHYINVGCTILGSTAFSSYQSKIRVLLVASSSNSRTYEVQFYETNWNHDTWQLETTGWTVYSSPQAPRTGLEGAKVNYISNQNADYQRANAATYSPIYYDSQDTGYYVDPNSTSKLVQVNLGTRNTRLTSNTYTGYVEFRGSASNYLAVGSIDNNGWGYIESVNNSNGLYLYTAAGGRFAFDNGDVTPYNDAENSLGNGSYRWSQVYTSGWLRQYGAQGMYNQDYGTHFYSNGGASWAITGSGGNVELQFRSNHQSTVRGYVYADTSNQIGFLNNGGSWAFRTTSDNSALVHGANLTINADGAYASNITMNDGDEGARVIHCNSNRIGFLNQSSSWGSWCYDDGSWATGVAMYSPIYYDSDDTAYYVDPNSNSKLVNLGLGGATPDLRLSVSGDIHMDGYIYQGGTAGVVNSWGSRTLVSSGNYVSNARSFRFDNVGYGSTWALDINSSGNVIASVDMRAPIFYDSGDTYYYVDPNSVSRLNRVGSFYVHNNYTVDADHPFGIYFDNSLSSGYAIFRESGSWAFPYPDLRISFHTGIKLGANASYNGIRFYTDTDMATQVMSVNNGSDALGAGNVYVNNSLQAGSSLRAPIFYDSNDTNYYGDFAGFSRMSEIGVTNNYVYNYFNIESSRAVAEFGNVGVFRARRSGAADYPSFSFQHQFGNHSWGQIARFHIEGGGGSDRPSIQFSSAYNNTRWNIGYCTGVDDHFRINQNMGYRPDGSGTSDGWGTERFRINTDGTAYLPSTLYTNEISHANGRIYLPGNMHIDTYNGNDIYMNYYSARGTRIYVGSGTLALHVNTDGLVYMPTVVVNSHSDNTKGYRISNTSGTTVSAMFVNSSNQLVIAAGAVDQVNLNKKVLVNGVALGVNVAPSATAGRIDASNDIVAYSSSDERLKYNIAPIENALDKVKSLTGVEFDWKPEYKHAHGYEGHDTGIIAQQVEAVMPSAVRTNDTGFLAVRYEKLIGLLIEANKELAARVEELEKKLN